MTKTLYLSLSILGLVTAFLFCQKEQTKSQTIIPSGSSRHHVLDMDQALLEFDNAYLEKIYKDNPSPGFDNENTGYFSSQVDDHWDVLHETRHVLLSAQFECHVYNGISLPAMDEESFLAFVKGKPMKSLMYLYVLADRWTDERLSESILKNDDIDQRISTLLPEKYNLTGLTRTKDNSYFPTNADEKKRVEAFEQERNALYEERIILPSCMDYYFTYFKLQNLSWAETYWCEEEFRPYLSSIGGFCTDYDWEYYRKMKN